jgi:signal transduction histidine kinase
MRSSTKRIVLAALLITVLLVFVNYLWWGFYHRTESLLEKQMGRRLMAIAATASGAIPPYVAESLLQGDADAFGDIQSLLLRAQLADSLAEIFILDPQYRYQASSEVETDSVYLLKSLNGAYLDSLFFGFRDSPIATSTYETGEVFLKSAFAPILDPNGVTIAVIGVEASIDYFDSLAELRTNLRYSTTISIIAGIVLFMLFVLLQLRLNKTEQQLFANQTQAWLGRMVAVVSHEVKNPLSIIRASAERLAKKTGADESRFIIEEVDRLNGIVTGYLDFARSGDFVLNEPSVNCNVSELIRNVRIRLAEKYPDTPINWMSSNPTGDIFIVTHPQALRQIFLNLLFNAVDSCLHHGREVRIDLRAEDNKETLGLIVSDNGAGIDERLVGRVFDPFETTKSSGSGLGLYISRKIVEAMHGTIELHSKPGDGTTVTITLPRVRE